jgi:aspartate/methionine/tyrosine aminotransferase
MEYQTFVMERTQSIWENRVELNLAESGVLPLTLGELLEGVSVDDTKLSYPQTNGTEELRDRISDLYPGSGVDNVVAMHGTAEANYIAVLSVLEPDDEAVVMLPNYMQVWGLAKSLGANVKPFPLLPDAGWKPDIESLERDVSDKTKLIAICNPNNPTGAVMSEEDMRAVAKIAGKVGAYLLVDEVYLGAELDSEPTPTFWGWYDKLMVTSGLSKAYGLPGLRIGWVVSDSELASRNWSYKDYTTIAPAALSDRLARMALEPNRRAAILARTRRILNEQLPILKSFVERHKEHLTWTPPRAGAIAFLRYDWDMNSTKLMERVRDEKGVLIVPGDHMGLDGYIRIGYGYDANQLREGLSRVSEVLDTL